MDVVTLSEDEDEITKAQIELHIWLEGRGAFLRGWEENVNPYPAGSIECQCWSDGWEDAQED